MSCRLLGRKHGPNHHKDVVVIIFNPVVPMEMCDKNGYVNLYGSFVRGKNSPFFNVGLTTVLFLWDDVNWRIFQFTVHFILVEIHVRNAYILSSCRSNVKMVGVWVKKIWIAWGRGSFIRRHDYYWVEGDGEEWFWMHSLDFLTFLELCELSGSFRKSKMTFPEMLLHVHLLLIFTLSGLHLVAAMGTGICSPPLTSSLL